MKMKMKIRMIQIQTLLFVSLVLFASLSLSLCRAYDAIRFSGGGIFFWWQAGAIAFLQEKRLYDNLPLYGTSAGALSATLLASKANIADAAKLAIELANEDDVWNRKFGLYGIWGKMIETWLEELIPDDIAQGDLARVHVVVTPRQVWKGEQLLTDFTSKEDLISGAMASAHIPFFLNKRPWKKYKDTKYIDGSFWQFIARAQEKYPAEKASRNILDVDHTKDLAFMKAIKVNSIVTLITPAGLYEMVERGYQYASKNY